jgi:hypothetical protein
LKQLSAKAHINTDRRRLVVKWFDGFDRHLHAQSRP